MTAEPVIAGREHWTHKGSTRLAYHILHSFFSQPVPVYQGG